MQIPVRVVLLRPQNPDNVGAVARAMKNFGAADWALVQPEFVDLAQARRLAVHAEDLLAQAKVVSSLDQAVADCVWVVGTSSRHVRGKKRMRPREWAKQAVARAGSGPVALVFGSERSGLSNEDVDRCHDLSAVAADDAQPSLNLAQAALLYLYELHEASRDAAPPPPPPTAQLATDAEYEGLKDALRRALDRAGFLRSDEARALRELLTPLQRSALTRHEASLWRAALESVGKRA